MDEQVRVRDLYDSPRARRNLHRARPVGLAAALALAFALTLGASASQARQKVVEPAAVQFAEHGPNQAARGKRAGYVAPRRTTRANWRKHHRLPAPEPTPTPSPSPTPAPDATPTPAPEPTPEPAPAPAPEPAPAPAPAPSGSVLFNGNFDAGFKGWYVQSLSTRATLFSSGAYQGSEAARFEVRQGDVEPDTGSQRSEVSGPTFKEGQDLYFRDAIRVPAGNTYSTPWQIIQQQHEEDWSGSPGMAVFLDNQQALKIGAGDGSPTFWQGPVLQSNRWYDLVYRVKLSQSSATGFVEVWLDGVQQKLINGQTRIYGQTIQMPETYLKAGIYRSKSSTGTSIVEHDAIEVGTSYAAVMAG
jgi:hypothetical protein